MKPVFLLRLVLDGVAAALLLFAFSYYWLGNTAHEVAGMTMFALLLMHGAFHRRWFVASTKAPRARRSTFNTVLTWLLLAGMLALLCSSLVISETVFQPWRWNDDFMVRRIHAGGAYWLMLVVAIHLGLRWPLLMGLAIKVMRVTKPSAMASIVLHLMAIAIAAQGVYSAMKLNLYDKLLFRMTLDWWDFNESVAGFFGHCVAVMGLCMFLTHHAVKRCGRKPLRARP